MKNLEIKICEKLPFNLTFFEKDGRCEKRNKDCKYYESRGELCKKQTLDPKENYAIIY